MSNHNTPGLNMDLKKMFKILLLKKLLFTMKSFHVMNCLKGYGRRNSLIHFLATTGTRCRGHGVNAISASSCANNKGATQDRTCKTTTGLSFCCVHAKARITSENFVQEKVLFNFV